MYLKTAARRKNRIYYVVLVVLILVAYYYLFSSKSELEITVPDPKISPFHDLDNFKPRKINRSFVIDYQNNQFLKDGEPFQYISGSLHYFRVPQIYWRDRLRKFRAAGLNAISTYVEWSTHEPSPRNYKFTGDQDIEHFLNLAAEEDLLVIARPGPYICAERDFGGLPPWFLNLYPGISLRTNDTDYEKEVAKWFSVLFPKLEKYLYGNGGPIIMVQIENEYGSYHAKNMNHRIWLRDLMKSYVKEKAVLFTTDGNTESYLRGGSIPDVYATVDFGTSSDVNSSFSAMRLYSPQGPLINSEFYPGWLSHWEEKMETVDTYAVLKTMKEMLRVKANFNFYMFYGGTNFGFTNGANSNSYQQYSPQLTSYDYDAPLDEAGDPTPKYYAIRKLISEHFKIPNIPIPSRAPKGNYGTVTLRPLLSIFNYSMIPEAKTITASQPKTFEQVSSYYGYLLYETRIPENLADLIVLSASGLRDRAIVYVDQKPAGILSRSRNIYSTSILAAPGAKLSLLVENQGRINYGDFLKDAKGLLREPSLNDACTGSWSTTTLPFEDISWIQSIKTSDCEIKPPAVYVGELILPANESPLDTFVDPTGWGKGIIFVNGFNLGRYWPSMGSQVTLYVPGCYLRPAPQKNIITVFETEYTHREYKLVFTNKPILNKIPPVLPNYL